MCCNLETKHFICATGHSDGKGMKKTDLKFWIAESQSLWNQDTTNMMRTSVHTTLDMVLQAFESF
jgi:hypothetical protein